MPKEKKLHIGTLDQIKGFKNISLDLKTYEKIYEISINNPMNIDLSVSKTIKFLLNSYLKNESNKIQKQLLESELANAKISKSKKVIKL
jgi:hypothetical protein